MREKLLAVQKWQQYLIMQPFTIRFDQQSLKYMLDHKISTPFQQKWLSKLADFDYVVEYKKGVDNKVVDALSRIYLALKSFAWPFSLCTPLSMQTLYNIGKKILTWRKSALKLQISTTSHSLYTWQDGHLRRKSKLEIGNNPMIKDKVLSWLHGSSQ